MIFTYKAKNSQGAKANGTVEADDLKAASALLREQGLFVLQIGDKKQFSPLDFLFKDRVPLKDKIIFTKQLSIMVRSGLSLVDALSSLKTESVNQTLTGVIDDLVAKVEGGTAFSEALAKHQAVFGDVYVNMVRSGEDSGKLDVVLDRLAIHLEKDYDLVRKIQGALYYPVFILVTMVVVIALVIVLVIPQLKAIFDDAGVSLPLITRGMIGLSFFLKDFGLYVLAVFVVLAVLIIKWQRTTAGKRFFDRWVLKVPILSMLLKKSYMARFTRTFAALVASGLPLLEVFRLSGKVIGNIHYEEEIVSMAKKVETGTAVSVVFKKSTMFPSMIGQLATIGEKSGNMDEVFDSMADFFEKDVDNITTNLSALLEPILMVIIGICVGFVIMAVLQPIYGLVNAI